MKTDFLKRQTPFSRAELIVFFLYLFAILILSAFHEPWEDELQAWCIARDLSVPGIFHQMRYEGHFMLWFLLLKPFAAAGLSLTSLNLVSVFLTAGAVIPFLMYRGFRLGFKIVILLSAPVLFWFPVVSRCYALIPPALCLLAGLYPVRLRHPYAYSLSLVLLVHSHAYMEGLAGILGAFFLWELMVRSFKMGGRRILTFAAVLLLVCGGVAFAFLQVAPAFGASSYAPAATGSIFADPVHVLTRIGQALLRLPECYTGRLCRMWGRVPVAVLFYIFLLTGVVQLFITRGRAGLFFLTGFFWQILFSALLFPMVMHRACLPLLMLVFCFALPVRRKRKRTSSKQNALWSRLLNGMIPVGLLALMSWPDSFYFAVSDVERPFSNQDQTAFFIRSKLPPDAKIVVFPASLITGTFRAYLPERTFYRCTDGEPFQVFRTVGQMPEKLDNALLEKYMEDAGTKDVYLLFQMGAFLSYWPAQPRERYEAGNFVLEAVFCSYPNAFFTAGEDYLIFRLTRK